MVCLVELVLLLFLEEEMPMFWLELMVMLLLELKVPMFWLEF